MVAQAYNPSREKEEVKVGGGEGERREKGRGKRRERKGRKKQSRRWGPLPGRFLILVMDGAGEPMAPMPQQAVCIMESTKGSLSLIYSVYF